MAKLRRSALIPQQIAEGLLQRFGEGKHAAFGKAEWFGFAINGRRGWPAALSTGESMKVLAKIGLAAAALATAATAQAWTGGRGGAAPIAAEDASYTCIIDGDISGASIAIGFGGQILAGDGWLQCTDNRGPRRGVVNVPVHMTMLGGGAGFEVSIVRAVHIRSAGVGVNDPSELFREFSVGASAGATLLTTGIGFDAAVRVGDASGFGFDLALQGRDAIGLGAHLYGMGFSIARR